VREEKEELRVGETRDQGQGMMEVWWKRQKKRERSKRKGERRIREEGRN